MKYIDEFRNKKLALKISSGINSLFSGSKIKIMEVCGSHTQSFRRFGLGKLLPQGIKFVSGPGCPVCVSQEGYIDAAVRLSRDKNNIIVTFADMLRVPGSGTSLEKERAKGASVLAVYSALESVRIAKENPGKKVIFLAVGFETTVPTVALTLLRAKKEGLKNLFFYCAFKLIPPALEYLARQKELGVSGFLLPGHVSAVIGTKPYEFIPRKYGIPCCVAGFEPLDMLEGIYLLVKQISKGKPGLENQYSRAVRREGNLRGQKIISSVFRVVDAEWRGLGLIPSSGLALRKEFREFDALRELGIKEVKVRLSGKAKVCRCADVIKGVLEPKDCPLFRKACAPDNPYGACMISSEGTCNVHYKYA